MEGYPKTVLVIDDEAATLTMFRLFLNAYGFNVLVAEDGKSGLALLHQHRPEIVFTDLKMPEMDGFEVLKEIKRVAPQTEVIVITGHGDMDLVLQALNLDATDFINKPIKRSALEAALQRATDRRRHPNDEPGQVEFELQAEIGRIRIAGTLKHDNRQELLRCCRRSQLETTSGILIQFSEHAAVNGAGIAALIQCLSEMRQKTQKVAVVGLSENFKVIFQMVGIGRFAVFYDKESDAREALLGKHN